MRRVFTRTLTWRRFQMRRLFCYLIGFVVCAVMVLMWFSETEVDKPESDPYRRVHFEYRNYYNINVEELSDTISAVDPLNAAQLKDPFTEHYFNKILSNSLPLDRPLPYGRDESCQEKKFLIPKEERGSVSVIITFHDEALSALLRTIISVLHRTPPDLLHEIVLVDDFSKKDFQETISNLPKVKYLKNDLRLGLIRSRNKAAKESSGRFLFFLDSHMEVNVGWLEPLLERIMAHKFSLVSPIVDVIDANTLEYKSTSLRLKAGFDWSLRFKWIPRSEEEMQDKSNPTNPFTSPMTSGGIFLIDKEWFQDLNTFDDQLETWGGESVEMSIKAWLCGGRIEMVPCSRVGHIFRKKHPYSFPKDSPTSTATMQRNSLRIAENWMEEFTKFYFLGRPQAKNTLDVPMRNSSAIDSLKERLQCRPFRWYLQVVFPELRIPHEDNLAYGELHQGDHQCLQIAGLGGALEMIDCFSGDYITTWSLHNGTNWLTSLSGGGSDKSANGCLTAYADGTRVGVELCRRATNDSHYQYKAQQWQRHRGTLVNLQTRLCLESLGKSLGMSGCRMGANAQLWHFTVEIEQIN